MAFNSYILDVGPTIQGKASIEGTAYVDPSGAQTDLNYPPTQEGELLAIRNLNPSSIITLYVGIETSENIFEWKRVQPVTTYIDTRTGQEWDPLASILYSYAR